MSWLLAVGGFSVLIVLHELGHFAVAKAVGMRVERFALFFGPRIVSVRRGETEYGIGVIPVGGYVKITGMNPMEELPPEVAHRAYYRQPVWKRVVVIVAGPLVNVLLAFVIIAGILTIKGQPTGTDRVAAVEHGYPAARALAPGDRIVAVDGTRLSPEGLPAAISAHRCAGKPVKGCVAATPARLTVRSARGATRTVALRPIYDPQAGRTRLGFGLDQDYVPEGLGAATTHSLDVMWLLTRQTITAIVKVVYDPKTRKQVSGVVGTTTVVEQTFKRDENVQALLLLALISLSLAIINLFPFLPLDGGHVFWAVAEKIRGRAISFRVMEQASVVGFVLVLMLFAVGLSNDIGRLSGDGFGVR